MFITDPICKQGTSKPCFSSIRSYRINPEQTQLTTIALSCASRDRSTCLGGHAEKLIYTTEIPYINLHFEMTIKCDHFHDHGRKRLNFPILECEFFKGTPILLFIH